MSDLPRLDMAYQVFSTVPRETMDSINAYVAGLVDQINDMSDRTPEMVSDFMALGALALHATTDATVRRDVVARGRELIAKHGLSSMRRMASWAMDKHLQLSDSNDKHECAAAAVLLLGSAAYCDAVDEELSDGT